MSEVGERRAVRSLPAPLARRFEAIVFDWDGTAVPDRQADASRVRHLVEQACGLGLELAIVSGTHVGNVDEQLSARPGGPGGLTMLLNRGSEVFRVDRTGPQLAWRRTATADEDAALSRAADLTVERLAARGLTARIVSERLNRRKIDLIPEPAWADPPKARIDELLAAVESRLQAAGISGLVEAVAIAQSAAGDAGVADPRVTSDAKHVEIGLTDKADSARWILDELWRSGIAPGQLLIAGDELGPLGGLTGSDAFLLVDEARRATAVSVGVEPGGLPDDVVALGGGPEAFAAIVEDQIERRRRGEPPVFDEDPAWTLTIDGVDPRLERVHQSLLALADGRLGTRGALLVSSPWEDPGVVMSGVYAGAGSDTTLLEAPSWNTIPPADHPELTARRVFDLHTGTLSQQLTSGEARLDGLQLSSLARPATALLRVRSVGGAGHARHGLDRPPGVAVPGDAADDYSLMRVRGSPGSIVAALHDDVRDSTADGRTPAWVLDRIACYEGCADGPADEQAALIRLRQARGLGFESLLTEHRRAWASRWQDADVRAEGDPGLQLAVRLALFHLMSSVADEGEAAVGARGLTGTAYRGHVFWDSDVYVLPFLAATHPRAARAMLEYRLRRLPAAMRAARELGRAGARFPWESAGSGEEVTPRELRNRHGELVPILTGEQEEHIVADVAWAAAHYADWTGDRAFAEGPGLELGVQAARWWASRIDLDADGRAHITGVIGPDEYHEHVDDNAYTNVMARWTLRRAAAAAPDGALDESERRRWLELAEALVDGYDRATGLYEQFAGFHALESLLIAEVAPRPVAADLLLGAERTRAAQVVKQPDVLMLHYLVPDEVAAGSLRANLDYYEPRTALGSTLSPGVHAALLARAGRRVEALELLRLTARIDLDDISQTTAGGMHMAAMGSLWRALAFGFAGLEPGTDGRLAIDPIPVPGLDALEVRVRFRDSRVRLRITPAGAEVSASPPITVVAPGQGAVEVGPRVCNFDLSTTTDRERAR